MDKKWKKVQETVMSGDSIDVTHRLEIDGGYLYRSIVSFPKHVVMSMVFVPVNKIEENKT